MFVPAMKRVSAAVAVVTMLTATGCTTYDEPASVAAGSTSTVEMSPEDHTVTTLPSHNEEATSSKTQSTVEMPSGDEVSVKSEACKGVSDETLKKFHGVMKCVALQDIMRSFMTTGVKSANVDALMHNIYFELCMEPEKPRKVVPPVLDADAPPATAVPLPHDVDSSDSRKVEHLVEKYIDVCKRSQ